MPSISENKRPFNLVLTSNSERDTGALGTALAAILTAGDVVLLNGDLGAGKTVLARSIIRSWIGDGGELEEVPSPTFTLVQIYEPPSRVRVPIWHFDLYRLKSEADIVELGFEEAMTDGICLIEWPDRLGAQTPDERLDIHLEFFDPVSKERPETKTNDLSHQRRITLTGHGGWAGRLAEAGLDHVLEPVPGEAGR